MIMPFWMWLKTNMVSPWPCLKPVPKCFFMWCFLAVEACRMLVFDTPMDSLSRAATTAVGEAFMAAALWGFAEQRTLNLACCSRS